MATTRQVRPFKIKDNSSPKTPKKKIQNWDNVKILPKYCEPEKCNHSLKDGNGDFSLNIISRMPKPKVWQHFKKEGISDLVADPKSLSYNVLPSIDQENRVGEVNQKLTTSCSESSGLNEKFSTKSRVCRKVIDKKYDKFNDEIMANDAGEEIKLIPRKVWQWHGGKLKEIIEFVAEDSFNPDEHHNFTKEELIGLGLKVGSSSRGILTRLIGSFKRKQYPDEDDKTKKFFQKLGNSKPERNFRWSLEKWTIGKLENLGLRRSTIFPQYLQNQSNKNSMEKLHTEK